MASQGFGFSTQNKTGTTILTSCGSFYTCIYICIDLRGDLSRVVPKGVGWRMGEVLFPPIYLYIH